jgi:shikimate kinase
MKAGPESAVHLVLIGMMGSGKSTVGRLLAERTGWPFYDNDTLLERATEMSARDLLAARGEEALHALEGEALGVGLAEPPPLIVAAAAGTVLDPGLRDRLRDATVVWLRARPEVLAQRIGEAEARPWRRGDRETWLTQTVAEREPLYRDVADLVVDTEGRTSDGVADEILTWLRSSPAYH